MYPVYKNIGTKENCEVVKVNFPPQHQDCHPGLEYLMKPRPISENVNYKGSNKLKDKVAIITGGDSGIGRAVAYAFAKGGETFGSLRSKVPMDRAGQPYEVAGVYVFLASDDSSYMTGQVIHINGGNVVG